MKVTITPALMEAIKRAGNSTKHDAYMVKHSKEYEETNPEGYLRQTLDRQIELKFQDADMIEGWVQRVTNEQKQGE